MSEEVFIDTSAFYAALVPEDRYHGAARTILGDLEREGPVLVSSSFVVLETASLLQARIGIEATRRFHESFVPLIELEWIREGIYQRSMAALLAASRRLVSLTDWSSFEVMRGRGIQRAFAFDSHFTEQGFVLERT